jgi:hypothetical protein
MKKIILIFFFISVISNPLLSNENDFKKISGSKKEGYFFISLSSIKVKGSSSFFTYLQNLPNKTEYGDSSYLASLEVKCKNYKYRFLGSRWYSQTFGKGILNAEYNDKGEWEVAAKKSQIIKLIDYTCKE